MEGASDNTWVDQSYCEGRWAVPLRMGMSIGSLGLGLFMLWLFLTETIDDTFSYWGTLITGIIFILSGILTIVFMYSFSNRARLIKFSNDKISIEFWWQIFRKKILLSCNDIHAVIKFDPPEAGWRRLISPAIPGKECLKVSLVKDEPFFVLGEIGEFDDLKSRLGGG